MGDGHDSREHKEVLLLNRDRTVRERLRRLLHHHHFCLVTLKSLKELTAYLDNHESRVVFINLDNNLIDNNGFRNLKTWKPRIKIIALSKRQFHPELAQALREYISVCLTHPSDPDELIYWLKVFHQEDANPL